MALYLVLAAWVGVCLTDTVHGQRYFLGYLLLGGLLVWAGRRLPERLRSARAVSALDMLALALALLFLVAELGTRAWYAVGHPPGWISSAPDPVRYRLDPTKEYLGTRPNDRGFYDVAFDVERRPGVRRVAALGDSYTVGMVPYLENYLTLVDDLLGEDVEVLNLGVVHTAVREYIEILGTEALRLDPDVVLVGVYIGNDIKEDLPSGLLSEQGSRVVSILRTVTGLVLQASRYEQTLGTEGWLREEADGTRTELPGMSVEEHLGREMKHLERIFREPVDRRARAAWEDTERALQDLVARCRRHGLPVVATLALREAEAQAHTYHLRGVHWNRHGNAAVARALAPWLAEQLAELPLPER